MQTLFTLIKIVLNLGALLVCWGSNALQAAQEQFEYRFERMLPQREQAWVYSGSIFVGADDSIWLSNYALQHFYTDGRFIHSYAIDSSSLGGFAATRGWRASTDGSLWTIDYKNTLVKHLSSEGHLLAQFGKQGEGVGELNSPQLIAPTEKGIWVTDSNGQRIQYFRFENNASLQYVYEKQITGVFSEIQQIRAAIDGSIWVLDNNGTRLQHFNSNGHVLRQLFISDAVSFGNDFTIAADGSLWFADSQRRVVQHLTADGGLLNQFPLQNTPHSSGNKLEIALAADGSVWLGDTGAIQHFKQDGTLLAQFDPIASEQFDFISNIALAADGSLWVKENLSNGTDRFQHFTAEGEFIETDSNVGVAYFPAEKKAPDGTQWVISQLGFTSCCTHDSIRHLQADGMLIAEFYLGDGSRLYPSAYHLAFAPDNTLWLLNTAEHKVQHFKSDGTLITQFGGFGEAIGQFSYPKGIALAADGSLWIADSGNDRVQHFSANGAFIEQLGSIGNGPGQFGTPSGIVLGNDNSIWVSERGNNRLQRFVMRPKSKTAHPYKAIILAGGGEQLGQAWPNIWQAALKSRNALSMQGFTRNEEILLLTAGNPENDVDNVTGLLYQKLPYTAITNPSNPLHTATKESLRLAITDWAKDTTDLVLYLASTGVPGQLQINATETVSANELATWLTELEKVIPGKVTVIIEADQSGSFLQALANPTRPRIVMTSSGVNQPALMADHGVNSFSYSFWNQVMDGAPLVTALQAGQQTLSPFVFNNQPLLQAQLDATGDGQSDVQDLTALRNYCLGMCTKTVSTPPVINLLTPENITLTNTTSAEFSMTLTSTDNIFEAWALVQCPSPLSSEVSNQLNLEKIQLACDAQGQCRGRYHRFNAQGTYRIHFYALDAHYQINTPVSIDVIQANAQAIIPAEYIAPDNTLYLYDVQVDQRHYQASLKQHNGLFQLQTLSLAPETLTPSAQFDARTGVLNIPAARVNGQFYQGSFKWVDNYLFQLVTATPK